MVSCNQIPTQLVLPDQPKVCCVHEYNFQGERIGNNACVIIGDGFSETDCTRNFAFDLLGGSPPLQLVYGTVADCCRDCFPPPPALVVSNGKLVRNVSGGKVSLSRSPNAEPEQCCCGDECTCKQVPDCEQVRCYPTHKPTTDDKCKGRCVIKTYDDDGYEVIDDRTMICKTQVQCCAEDDSTCDATCTDGSIPPVAMPNRATPAANQWDIMPSTTCGVCCVNNYDEDPISPKFRQVLSVTATKDKTKEECEASHPFLPDPANPFGPVGVWHAGTDNLNICNPLCCQSRTLGDRKEVVCGHTSATKCDPCVGSCIEIAREDNDWLCPRVECKTKQECCGADNAKCTPQCGKEKAEYRWEVNGCGTVGSKCGACCRIVYDGLDSSANVFSAECAPDIVLAGDCALNADDTMWLLLNPYYFIQYKWKPFETCETAKCGTKKCCGPTCPDDVGCIDIDINAECDPCKSRCYAIVAETAACATKQECCGEFNEKCVPQVGFCPDSADSIPTHNWSGACADPELCGVCCKKKNDGTYTCDPTKTNQTDCDAENYGVWRAFATCAACGNTAQACIESTCKRIVTVNGVDEEQTYTYAACKPVAPDKVNCKGVCTELSTPAKPYESKTCKTKSSCCGPNNIRCGDGCGTAATHSWSSACNDPEKCGVCCVTTNVGGGNISASPPEENIGRAACEAKGQAGGGLGVTAVWKPFGTARDCSIEKCCGTCPDGSIACIDQPPGTPCLQPCNGRCYTVDAAGNLDPTQPAVCATKETCCMQNGINVCQNECNPGKRWTPTCSENEYKCGVACKTTLSADGTTILGSVCQPGITTYQQFQTARAALPANQTLTWKPWDTCATVICQSKKCCKEKCPGVLGCVDVDVSDPCKKCEGLCYDAVVDPDTGVHSKVPGAVPECSTRVNCCGAGNEKCAEVPNCPNDNAKIFERCCDDDVFRACQCGDADDGPPNLFSFSNNSIQTPPAVPGFPNGFKREACDFRLDGLISYFISYYLQSRLWGYGSDWRNKNINTSERTFADPCRRDGTGDLLPTFSWKDCYPTLIDNNISPGNIVYVFSQARYGFQSLGPDGGTVPYVPLGVEYSHDIFTRKFTFYVCQGKKLVEVTDAIINKLSVRGCQSEYKQYERRCVRDLVIFSAEDHDALGLPSDPVRGIELTAFGATGYYYAGYGDYPGGRRVFVGERQRPYERWYNDMLNGTLKLKPMAADGNGYSKDDPRTIFYYQPQGGFTSLICDGAVPVGLYRPPLPPNMDPSNAISTSVEIPDAFNNTFCRRQITERLGEAPPAGPPMSIPGYLYGIESDCCAVYETTFTEGLSTSCTHEFEAECGQFFDAGLPNTTPLNCPQDFTQNPLP